MGVDKKEYLIVGYKLPWEVRFKNGLLLNNCIWEDEKYLPMVEGWQGEPFTIVSDGMSGEYIVFGITIESADEYEGFDFCVIDEKLLSGQMEQIKQRAIELFSDLEFDFSEPKVLLFSHYS